MTRFIITLGLIFSAIVMLLLFRAGTATATLSETKLTASDAVNGDNLGFSVSVDGDFAAVATRESGAYIYERNGTTWTEEATRIDGYLSVSVSGDTVLAGAHNDNEDAGGGNATGAAYVYVRNGSTWTQEATLIASDA